jgi:hypothetical protein
MYESAFTMTNLDFLEALTNESSSEYAELAATLKALVSYAWHLTNQLTSL